MRELLGILCSVCLLWGCAALRDDMRRAEAAFDQAQYEETQVWLEDLEKHVAEMEQPMRARFYYLRGTTAYRLGHEQQARHYLALAREEGGEQGLGLRAEWRSTLDELLAELAPDSSYGGEKAAPDSEPPELSPAAPGGAQPEPAPVETPEDV